MKGNQDGFLTMAGFMEACSLQSEPDLCQGREGALDSNVLTRRRFAAEFS